MHVSARYDLALAFSCANHAYENIQVGLHNSSLIGIIRAIGNFESTYERSYHYDTKVSIFFVIIAGESILDIRRQLPRFDMRANDVPRIFDGTAKFRIAANYAFVT